MAAKVGDIGEQSSAGWDPEASKGSAGEADGGGSVQKNEPTGVAQRVRNTLRHCEQFCRNAATDVRSRSRQFSSTFRPRLSESNAEYPGDSAAAPPVSSPGEEVEGGKGGLKMPFPRLRRDSQGQRRLNFDSARILGCLRANALTILSLLGVVSGAVIAIVMRSSRDTPWTQREIAYVGFVGDLFLRMLKALILPLIVSSLVSAIGGLDLRLSGRIGLRAIVYYMSTTFSAVVLGIILVTSIHPGGGSTDGIKRAGKSRETTAADTLMDLIRNVFPPNLVQACIQHYRTILKAPVAKIPEVVTEMNVTESPLVVNSTMGSLMDNLTTVGPTPNPLYNWTMEGVYDEGTNMLGVVTFGVVLGITLGKMGPKGKPLLAFFQSLSEAMMIITGWIIWLSPIGVLSLVAAKMLEMESLDAIVGQLGMYFLTVMIGLFIHGFIVLTSIFFIVTRKLPFRFISNMTEALITAFTTSSSTATLPVALACLEDQNGIDPRVTRFVMPIGATINMDGTALYEAVAAIFISQVRGLSLNIGNIVAISITATAASIGAAGIPQAGLVTMVMVLDTVGLPAEDVTLILAVDWFLDRFRTFTNVLGDSLGAGIVHHLSRAELDKQDNAGSNQGELVAVVSSADIEKVEGNCIPMGDKTSPVVAETGSASMQSTAM